MIPVLVLRTIAEGFHYQTLYGVHSKKSNTFADGITKIIVDCVLYGEECIQQHPVLYATVSGESVVL